MTQEELYKKILAIVADVDPMGFLGLPDTDANEYSPEVVDVIQHLHLFTSKKSAITLTIGIFNHWFGGGPVEKYEIIGTRILLLWNRVSKKCV